MKKSLREQFANLRNDPRFGARSDEFFAAEEAKLMLAIGANAQAPEAAYTWSDYFQYYREILGPTFIRTFGTGMAAIALLFSGWLTTVHAAGRSLPGDALYGFKLITEQAQLKVSSLEQRAILHTEFAERRLREAVSLQENGSDAGQGNVIHAYAAFRQEIAFANSNLKELQVNKSGAAVHTAGLVEKRLNALDDVLDQTAAVSGSAAVSTVAQQAKDASREVQSAAVGVIVDDHEEKESAQSQRELSDMFMREYGNVQARHAFDLHRIEVLRNALALHSKKLTGVTLPSEAELASNVLEIKRIGGGIGEAMNSFAIGGYRKAFDILHELDSELLLVEARLAQAEIAITNALSAPAPEAPEAPEETPTEISEPVTTS